MYKFINNYSETVELTAGQTHAALALPDGKYRLTIADNPSAATRWEIIDAAVTSGSAILERAKEGTVAQAWPAGSIIYNALTAETLNSILSDVKSLKSEGPNGEGLDPEEPIDENLVFEYLAASGLDLPIFLVVVPTAGGSGVAIDTGDGNSYNYSEQTALQHTYSTAGDYLITVSGDLDGLYFQMSGETKIVSWGKKINGTIDEDDGFTYQLNPGHTNIVAVPATLPPWVTSLDYFFFNSPDFNQDISGWDTGNVSSMDYMFCEASSFNQDLSGWCVPLIESEPESFADGAYSWALPKPVWGTCPP